jgi:hypothetical protein
MNTMINNGLKALTCGAAAVVITLVVSFSFVHSTAKVHNDNYIITTLWLAKLSLQHPVHAWFGQPHPAVLVD